MESRLALIERTSNEQMGDQGLGAGSIEVNSATNVPQR